MFRRGFKVPDRESFFQVQKLLAELGEEVPIRYLSTISRAQEPVFLLSERSFQRIVPLLQKQGIQFSEVKVTPMSDLSPEEQARLRGLKP